MPKPSTRKHREADDLRARHRRITRALVLPQALIWGLLAAVPVTFKGEPGIDISIALLMVLASFVLAIVSLISAFRSVYFHAFALQVSLPALVVAAHFAIHELRMPPTRDAAEYQHLVGWTRARVEDEFGTYGSQVTHYRQGSELEFVLLYYPGLKLTVSSTGSVVAVESD